MSKTNREIIEEILFPNGNVCMSQSPYMQKASEFKPAFLENAAAKIVPGTNTSEIVAMEQSRKGKKGIVFTENGFADSDFNFLAGKKERMPLLVSYADIQEVSFSETERNGITILYKNGVKREAYCYHKEFMVYAVTHILEAMNTRQQEEITEPEQQAEVQGKSDAEKSEAIQAAVLDMLHYTGVYAEQNGLHALADKIFALAAEEGYQI